MSELIVGGMALAGVWIGSILNRQTQQRTWLLEKRAEAFPEYLQRMEKCLLSAIRVFENEDDCIETNIKITELYFPVSYQADLVKLYISPETRSEFSQLTKEIWGHYSSLTKKNTNKDRIYKNLERIQSLFQKNIQEPKFVFGKIPWLSRMKTRLTRKHL